jgi:hypothetical protein
MSCTALKGLTATVLLFRGNGKDLLSLDWTASLAFLLAAREPVALTLVALAFGVAARPLLVV